MARFGFVGPTYSSQSVIADCQRCFNWYPEMVESGQGKSQMVLYPTPGLKQFAAVAGAVKHRGCLAITSGPAGGQAFFVIGAIGLMVAHAYLYTLYRELLV